MSTGQTRWSAEVCCECGNDVNTVIDSRPKDIGRWRRRECVCGHRWTTVEVSVSMAEAIGSNFIDLMRMLDEVQGQIDRMRAALRSQMDSYQAEPKCSGDKLFPR